MHEIAALRHLELYEAVVPTSEICGRLLEPRASVINAAPRETFKYGPHARHDLDLYTPSKGTSQENNPLLVFLYGGGFASGDKLFDLIPGDLVYKNLGSFFAEELGFDVAIVNYRLTAHGARFPRGADDLDLALRWLDERYKPQGPRDLYIMGNSAGGIHLTTWLFWPDFRDTINWLVSGTGTLTLRVGITLGCPFTWPQYVIDSKVGDSVKGYYGDEAKVKENAALLLVQKALETVPVETKWPSMLVLVSEMDPADIRDSGKQFVDLWTSSGRKGQYHVLEGHNHFSTVWSLRSGGEAEEKWARDTAKWLQELMR
ncbi:Carboxylesterase type B [Fonsecaea pedrosoi]|nr:Carboxylesterase type B [Fonsecaea pedrosoi]